MKLILLLSLKWDWYGEGDGFLEEGWWGIEVVDNLGLEGRAAARGEMNQELDNGCLLE